MLENESSATLLRLMQGEAPGPVVLREDDRPMAKVTRIENITWKDDNGDTVVVIWGDGGFTPTSTGYLRLEDPPREIVKLFGAEVPYDPAVIAIDSPHVERVRLGFHIGRGFNEIHIVSDLANEKVLLKRIELKGDQLHIRFGR